MEILYFLSAYWRIGFIDFSRLGYIFLAQTQHPVDYDVVRFQITYRFFWTWAVGCLRKLFRPKMMNSLTSMKILG